MCRLSSKYAFWNLDTCSFFRLSKSGSAEQVALLQNAVERKVPIMIQFLSNDYDDVSAAVLEFAKEYIHVSIIWKFSVISLWHKTWHSVLFNLKLVMLLQKNDMAILLCKRATVCSVFVSSYHIIVSYDGFTTYTGFRLLYWSKWWLQVKIEVKFCLAFIAIV